MENEGIFKIPPTLGELYKKSRELTTLKSDRLFYMLYIWKQVPWLHVICCLKNLSLVTFSQSLTGNETGTWMGVWARLTNFLYMADDLFEHNPPDSYPWIPGSQSLAIFCPAKLVCRPRCRWHTPPNENRYSSIWRNLQEVAQLLMFELQPASTHGVRITPKSSKSQSCTGKTLNDL